jgi:hypothetical protein
MSIRPLLIILGASLACISFAQAEDVYYPSLLCSDFLAMDSAAQEEAINWLNGKVAGNDPEKLNTLVDTAYSVTIDGCKKAPESKVINVIKHQPF